MLDDNESKKWAALSCELRLMEVSVFYIFEKILRKLKQIY